MPDKARAMTPSFRLVKVIVRRNDVRIRTSGFRHERYRSADNQTSAPDGTCYPDAAPPCLLEAQSIEGHQSRDESRIVNGGVRAVNIPDRVSAAAQK
jgi:hypothetical protein